MSWEFSKLLLALFKEWVLLTNYFNLVFAC
uniref:Uncharacterized protein n=1 Tax=Rhizophora mucronata TaxID=61149 RepID=A0A2P2QVT1_RHIMU